MVCMHIAGSLVGRVAPAALTSCTGLERSPHKPTSAAMPARARASWTPVSCRVLGGVQGAHLHSGGAGAHTVGLHIAAREVQHMLAVGQSDMSPGQAQCNPGHPCTPKLVIQRSHTAPVAGAGPVLCHMLVAGT